MLHRVPSQDPHISVVYRPISCEVKFKLKVNKILNVLNESRGLFCTSLLALVDFGIGVRGHVAFPRCQKSPLASAFSTRYRTVVVYYSLEMFSSSKVVATVNFVALSTVVTAILYFLK